MNINMLCFILMMCGYVTHICGSFLGIKIPPLHRAAQDNNLALVRTLLKSDEVSVDERDAIFNQTALFSACIHRNPEIAEELIRWGADINARDGSGQAIGDKTLYMSISKLLRLHAEVQRLDLVQRLEIQRDDGLWQQVCDRANKGHSRRTATRVEAD